jgi:hypothetical protein
MRTFNVNVKGATGGRWQRQAEGFLCPDEAANGRWCFLSAEGQVLWSWPAEDVRSVVEEITLQVK